MAETLHTMIYDDLLKKIKTGVWKQGDLLPTEKELTRIYGASAAPVRQALAKLAGEDLIVRKQGKGTFVHRVPWFSLGGFGWYFERDWGQIEAHSLSVELVRDDAVGEILGVGTAKVIKIPRVRSAKGKAIFFVTHYLTNRFDIEIFRKNRDFFSLRDLLQQHYSLEIAKIKERLSSIIASGEVAERLNVSEGDAIMRMERKYLAADGSIVCYDSDYANTADWKYINELTYVNSRETNYF